MTLIEALGGGRNASGEAFCASITSERFWRGRGVTRQGAGLGLAIVSEIAKAHGGSIEVADRPGGGALFTLLIPLA